MSRGLSLPWRNLLFAALAFSPAAVAQVPATLSPVVVPAPPAPAFESPTRRDPTGAVTVIAVSERRGEAKAAAELLAQTPSMVVQDSGGLGQSKSLSLRGASGNGVLVLLDGVPLNGAGGGVDFSLLSEAIIDRIEVLRGGAGARYGSGGLGGAVNVVTRAPTTGARLFAEVTQGSFSTTLAHAGATGSWGGAEGLLLLHGARSAGNFSYLRDDLPELEGNPFTKGPRENNQSASGGGLFKLRRKWGAVSTEASVELSADQRGLAGTPTNPTLDAREQTVRGSGTLRSVWALPNGELGARAFARRDDLTLEGGFFGSGYRQLDQALGVELEGSSLVAERHGLSASASVAGEWLREPTFVNPSWARLSAMVGDEILFHEGDWVLAPSLRVDRTGPFTGLSPKLGASARLPSGFGVKGNLGQAHRAPSFLELYVEQGFLMPNRALRPERALYADLAVSHTTRRSELSVGVFESLYEDLISYELYAPQRSQATNFQAARVRGLELEALVRPAGWLSLMASYTLLHTENLKDDPRYYLNALPYRPRHKVYGRVTAGPRWLSGRAELLFQSEQFINRSESPVLPARSLMNVGLSSQLLEAPSITVSLELKNLLDVQSQDISGYPLPGRAAYLTVALAFDSKFPPPSSSSTSKESVASR